MLSTADQQLVRRDPHLPGLRLLLDEKDFSQRMARQLSGWENGQLVGTYLRYKPATNCLAAYRIQPAPLGSDPAEPLQLYAKAFRSRSDPKFLKEATLAESEDHLADDVVILPDEAVIVRLFPADRRLGPLRELTSPGRSQLLQKLLPQHAELWDATPQVISYKPERRCVLCLKGSSGKKATVRCYTPSEFATADSRGFSSTGVLQIPERLGRSRRHRLLAFEWLDGRPLSEQVSHASCETMQKTGEALAEYHLHDVHRLKFRTHDDDVRDLNSIAHTVEQLCPRLRDRCTKLANTLADRLLEMPLKVYPIHGDFYADQVLVSADKITILDFDEAAFGNPASDLGNFAAHLDRQIVDGRLNVDTVEALIDSFLDGYRQLLHVSVHDVDIYRAASLFRQATHPFRSRRVDWPGNIESIISRVEALLESYKPARIFIRRRKFEPLPSPSITIDDRDVLHDPKLGFIAPALDPQQVVAQFKRVLPHWPESEELFRLRSIGVVRHKPQRRCLIEYEFDGSGTNNDSSGKTLIGKVNSKFLDLFSYRIQQMLFEEAFHPTAEDGICVPQPLGVIPEWNMWLQQKVQGDRLTNQLESTEAEQLVARTAQAIFKLHCTVMPVHRNHSPRDELDTLHKCVPKVLCTHPEWQEPVWRILSACDRLATSLPENCKTFLHRDFYPDQLLIEGESVTLLDYDLCCLGDPALDIGNFHAHLTEHALRHNGQPETLSGVQNAFLESYMVQAGENVRSRVQIYSTLTLVRHIYLSSLFPDRRHLTPALIELSAEQLGVRLKGTAVATSSTSSRTKSHISIVTPK